MSSGGEIDLDGALFQEPAGYFPPEPAATFVEHKLLSGQTIQLRLVGQHPLWGHRLWNGGQAISKYLQQHGESEIRNTNVLELGAGAGLCGLVAAILGAQNVVITDYPDEDLISNLRHNIASCALIPPPASNISALGYLWGYPADPLLSKLITVPSAPNSEEPLGFDLLLLADLLFNHSEHPALVSTVQSTLKRTSKSKALVFFTPYTPRLLEKDMAFFALAVDAGFEVRKIWEEVLDAVMFEKDPGVSSGAIWFSEL
ncbi:nicotinamide n-methyltransferase [Pseudocyphellaria aurata]|nr:nicotinamide n-methyltransferase [Pseudocyphellaria aurata]